MTVWTPTSGAEGTPSSALHTDHYELTALDAAIASGVADRRAVFEVFARDLPPGRRYGVVAGVARAIDAVTRFRFHDAELDWLRERGFLRQETLDWLARYQFSGAIDGYHDGELFFPYSPILTVEAPLREALVLETVLLSILNHDSAVAGAAARMADVARADGRATIEGGSRRTHEEAAVHAALAAYVAGIDVTSNLEAGRRFAIPTAGTTMHAFILAHDSEEDAFRAQVEALGAGSTFLVDTYDIPQGIRRAVAVAGPQIGAVRLDSGHLHEEAHKARALLDELGVPECRIVVSGDLDEHRMAALADAPVDSYMLGTRLVTGSGAPTAELVYKLVAVARETSPDAPFEPVAKTSAGKGHRGGRKVATRQLTADGIAEAERIATTDRAGEPVPAGRTERPLQVPWVRDGETIRPFVADAARAHHRSAM